MTRPRLVFNVERSDFDASCHDVVPYREVDCSIPKKSQTDNDAFVLRKSSSVMSDMTSSVLTSSYSNHLDEKLVEEQQEQEQQETPPSSQKKTRRRQSTRIVSLFQPQIKCTNRTPRRLSMPAIASPSPRRSSMPIATIAIASPRRSPMKTTKRKSLRRSSMPLMHFSDSNHVISACKERPDDWDEVEDTVSEIEELHMTSHHSTFNHDPFSSNQSATRTGRRPSLDRMESILSFAI